MNLRPRNSFRAFLLTSVCAAALASSGVVIVLSTNQVSNSGISNYRWETTSASGTTWAHGWYDWSYKTSLVSSWQNGSWLNQQHKLTLSNGTGLLDLNLKLRLQTDPLRFCGQ